MTTANDIITRALRRIRVVDASEALPAEDAALALDMLNSMILNWPSQGVQSYYTALALSDTFAFFVPPADATGEVIDLLNYRGVWNASTNSPTLADGTGTKGYFYKVTTAGSTTLDDVTSWAVNDYAVFDGENWLQSINSSRFEQAVIDMLATQVAPDFGKDPSPLVLRGAATGWAQIQAAYIKAPTATLDRAVMQTIQRGYAEEDIEAT